MLVNYNSEMDSCNIQIVTYFTPLAKSLSYLFYRLGQFSQSTNLNNTFKIQMIINSSYFISTFSIPVSLLHFDV